jgi:vacuolar-type H+-ATPase subunit I/STV1
MPSDFAHCRKDRQMPTNTCPHCGTVCGSHIADEGHVLQSKECQRRELAALVNRVEQLAEQLAAKDAAAVEASKLFLRSLKAASAERDAATAELARLREGVARIIAASRAIQSLSYLDDDVLNRQPFTTTSCAALKELFDARDELAALAAGEEAVPAREPYSRSQARRLMVQTGAADDATRIAAALEGLLERHHEITIADLSYGEGREHKHYGVKWHRSKAHFGTLLESLESALHAKTAGEG